MFAPSRFPTIYSSRVQFVPPRKATLPIAGNRGLHQLLFTVFLFSTAIFCPAIVARRLFPIQVSSACTAAKQQWQLHLWSSRTYRNSQFARAFTFEFPLVLRSSRVCRYVDAQACESGLQIRFHTRIKETCHPVLVYEHVDVKSSVMVDRKSYRWRVRTFQFVLWQSTRGIYIQQFVNYVKAAL